MDKFNLILTSNGFNNIPYRSEEIDNLFKQIANNKKILLISNATKTGSNILAKEIVKENFEKVGCCLVDILDIDTNNVHKIFEYDVIYLMGGDVKPILEDFQSCTFKEYLLDFLKSGICIAESAGCIILCEDVRWIYDIKKGTKPKYDILPTSFLGVNIINKKIFPHFNSLKDDIKEKIKIYESENSISITSLNDGEFIIEYITL